MEGDGFRSLVQVGDKNAWMDSKADQKWVVVKNNTDLWLANTDPNNNSSCSEGCAPVGVFWNTNTTIP